MYSLKRLLEIKAERERKQEERKRLKEEKERLKKEERRLKRKKRLHLKWSRRYHAKEKKALEEYRKRTGDEVALFSIYLMKDGKRIKFCGSNYSKNEALKLYYEMLRNNNEKVKFPLKYAKTMNHIIYHKYELILVRKIPNDEIASPTLLRNEEGKFVENCVIDTMHHKILDKNEWLIEESFNVYGFDSQRDRKDFSYIYDNIILSHTDKYTRLFVYRDKLIHHYDDDFDMVICKDSRQAVELYDTIEKVIDKKKYPNIFFMGKISGRKTVEWVLDEMQKKTGWTREKCKYAFK